MKIYSKSNVYKQHILRVCCTDDYKSLQSMMQKKLATRVLRTRTRSRQHAADGLFRRGNFFEQAVLGEQVGRAFDLREVHA